MKKTVLVTGGAGFIGSHLVDALVARGWRVTVVDDLSTGNRKNLNSKAIFKKMDICSPAVSKLILSLKPQAIFHLAAQTSVPISVREPERDAKTNIMATIHLLDAAAQASVKHFIMAGTGGALSSEDVKLPTDEAHADKPRSPYAIAKVASEFYGSFFRKTRGLNFTSFRFANVYGPRQNPHGEAGVIAVFCKRMLANEPVRINGNGLQTRDYVYVKDIVTALLLGLGKVKAKGPFHLGTGKEIDVKTLFNKISILTGYKSKPQKAPADIGAPKRSVLDSHKARKEFGWSPKVSLEQGLKETVNWFRQYGNH